MYLDEGRPCQLHGLDEEAVPPQGAAALIVAVGAARADPDGGHGKDDGDENANQVQETQSGA